MARAFPFAGQESGESDYYLLHRESGVVEGLNISFSGLTWSLSPGQVYAGGAMIVVDGSPETGASTPTAAASPRRDMLVARRVLAPGGSSYGEIDVIQGGPATSPSDPTLTQDLLGTFEEPLFSWQVPGNGGGTVTGVRDLRRPAQAFDRGNIAHTSTGLVAAAGFAVTTLGAGGPSGYEVHEGVSWLHARLRRTSATAIVSGASGNIGGDLRVCSIPASVSPSQTVYAPFFVVGVAMGGMRINPGGAVDITDMYPNNSIRQNTVIELHAQWRLR